MPKIQKLCVLNAGDKVRHYTIASGEGAISQDSGEIITDIRTFPKCSQYTDLRSKILYVRMQDTGNASDWLPIGTGGGGGPVLASGVLFEDGLNAEEKVAEIKDEVQPTIDAVGVAPVRFDDVTTIQSNLIWGRSSWKTIDGRFESPTSDAAEYKSGYIKTQIEGIWKFGCVLRNGTAVIKSKLGNITKIAFWIEPYTAGDVVELSLHDGMTRYIRELTYIEYEIPESELGRLRITVNNVYANFAIDKAWVETNNIARLDVIKMEQYILGYSNGHITHAGQPLTFAEVKAAVEDTSKFVYLDFANALHLPCFIVDSEGNSAVAFSAAFQVSGAPYIERVAINEQEEVKIDNMRCVHFNENDGVAIGDSCEASGDYSHAEGYETTASGYCSHAEGDNTTASGYYSHAEGEYTTASGYYSHAEGEYTEAGYDYQYAQGRYNNADDFDGDSGAFMHGCGTDDDDRKNAFAIAEDGKIYVIGLGGYDGTNHEDALSLQDLFGTANIQASTNKAVNGYQVPNLTPAQVTAAYNAVVAGRYVTITDATGNYHLGVTQADVLNGDLAISLIFLNVMLLTYEISGSTVDVQFKNL